MSRRRVLCLGWVGAANVGDELLLALLRDWLDALGHDLVAMSIDPGATRAMHGIEALDRHDLVGVAAAMQESDLFVLGGGGLFNTHFQFTEAGLFDWSSGDIAAYCRPVLMARQLGVPVLAWAHGLGPLEGAEPRALVADTLGQCLGVSVRDDASLALAREIGVAAPLTMAPDPVWAYPVPASTGGVAGRERIAVVVRPWQDAGWEQTLLDALRAELAGRDCTLVWIPFQLGDVPGRSGSDRDFVAGLAARLGQDVDCELCEWQSLGDVIETLSGCDRVIAMRLHAQILAISMGKPCLTIEYDQKMAAASRQCGLPGSLRLDVSAPPPDWRAAVAALMGQAGSPVSAETRERLAREALAHRDVLADALARAGRNRLARPAQERFDWLGTWEKGRHERETALLAGRLAGEAAAAADLRSQLTALQEQVARLQDGLHGREQALTASEARLAALQESLDEAVAQAGQARSARDALARELAERDREHALASADHARVEASLLERVRAGEDEALRLGRELRSTRNQLAGVQAQLHDMLTSRSWRITAPLRALVRRLQRHLGAGSGSRTPVAAPQPAYTGFAPAPAWVEEMGFASEIVIITSGFEFDELVNQRPINAAKWYALNGVLVVFVVWQWSEDEPLVHGTGYVGRNILQVPLYEFIRLAPGLPRPDAERPGTFLVTLPAPILLGPAQALRSRGYAIHYDIMDEWEEFAASGQAPWYTPEAEAAFVLAADTATCVSPALALKFAGLRRDIAVVGNGYTAALLGESARGIARSGRHSGVVGYFGHLTDAWLDWELVFEMARAHPQLRFEMIGYGEPEWVREQAARVANVALLGKVHPSSLSEHVRGWQLGLIPFRPGRLAEAVDPIKVYEYLYFGLPVLCTGIPHLAGYPGVTFAPAANAVRVLGECLRDGEPDAARIDAFLRDATWDARFREIRELSVAADTLGALYRA